MPTSSHASIAKVQTEVRELLPSLSSAQANVLGEMVYAMLMVDGCGMTRMCSFLSELLGKSMKTLRQKYREIYYEKEAKAGVKKRQRKRREIVVEEHFADLLRGVLKQWHGPQILVLAASWQRPHGSFRRAVDQRAHAGVWDTCRLDHPARASRGRVATTLGTHAQATGTSGPR